MEELIGEFTLKNDYQIFRVDDGYKRVYRKVSEEHTQYISNEICETSQRILSGSEWEISQAAERLKDIARSEDWPICYGYKLQHFVQAILLCIVANDGGEYVKEGRKFIFTIY